VSNENINMHPFIILVKLDYLMYLLLWHVIP